jgi:hypothetical protein
VERLADGDADREEDRAERDREEDAAKSHGV